MKEFWKELNVENPKEEKKINLPVIVEKQEPLIPSSDPKAKNEDFDLSRKTIHEMIGKGTKALDELIEIASQDQSPRMYEVVANLIKTLSETAKDLQLLHEKQQKIENGGFEKRNNKSDVDAHPPVHVDKAVFVGTTKELIQKIKEQK